MALDRNAVAEELGLVPVALTDAGKSSFGQAQRVHRTESC